MADAAVASLFLDLRARTAKLEKDLDVANSKIRRKMQTSGRAMSRDMSTAMAGLGKVAAFAGVTIGLNAIKSGVLDLISTSSELQTTADKLGLTVTGLQELRSAADGFNISQGTTDMALQRFSRRLAEAAQGGGELKGTLDQYGIAARDSEGRIRGTMEVLRDYADVIKNAESDQERLRLAFKAFDSEGVSFVNLLKDGAAGLAEYTVQAHAFGQVVEADQIRRLAELDNRLKNVAGSWQVFKTSLLSGALDLGEAIGLGGIENTLDGLEGRIEALQINMSLPANAANPSAPLMAMMQEDLDNLRIQQDAALMKFARDSHTSRMAIAKELENAAITRDVFQPDSESYAIMDRRVQRLTASSAELHQVEQVLMEKYPQLVALITELSLAEQGRANALALTSAESAKLASILASTVSPAERFQEQIDLLNKAMEAMPERTEEFQEAIKRVTVAYEESLDPKPINVFIDNWEDMTKAIPRNLSEALLDGEQGIKGFLARVLRQLAAAQLEAAIVAPFLQALGIGGGGGGGTFGGGGSGWWSTLASSFGGGGSAGGSDFSTAYIRGYASGGDPPVGRPYLVGEDGPELRIDRTPGTIIPNHEIGEILAQARKPILTAPDTGPMASIDGAALMRLPGFATGGDPPVGRPYLVGEDGPEIRIDRTPGTIIPNHEIDGVMGKGSNLGGDTITVNQTIHFPTNLADVRNQIRTSLPIIVQATESAIADNRRRRGAA